MHFSWVLEGPKVYAIGLSTRMMTFGIAWETHIMGKIVVFVGFISSGKKYNTEDPVIIFQDHLLLQIPFNSNFLKFHPQVAPTTPRSRSTHHSPFPLALFSVLVVEGWMSFTSATSYLTRSMFDILRTQWTSYNIYHTCMHYHVVFQRWVEFFAHFLWPSRTWQQYGANSRRRWQLGCYV